MNSDSGVVTVWYINVDSPAEVLNSEPRADRGFGRKFLSQLNPAFPVTPIGMFPLNRSAEVSDAEFYIGGYPGVTVVQTVVEEGAHNPVEVSAKLRQAIPAREVLVFIYNPETGSAGFARWVNGELLRCFAATSYTIYQDTGLPDPFEGDFWAGIQSRSSGPTALPFQPYDMMRAAQDHWVGVEVGAHGPDLQVAGFAVDGRPAPRIDEVSTQRRSIADLSRDSAAKLGLGPGNADYDDYEDHTPTWEDEERDEYQEFMRASFAAVKRLSQQTGQTLSRVAGIASENARKLRRLWK